MYKILLIQDGVGTAQTTTRKDYNKEKEKEHLRRGQRSPILLLQLPLKLPRIHVFPETASFCARYD